MGLILAQYRLSSIPNAKFESGKQVIQIISNFLSIRLNWNFFKNMAYFEQNADLRMSWDEFRTFVLQVVEAL
jgi:hypothetical protein